MTEHLSEQTIGLYREGHMDAAERRQADAHLAVCEACTSRVMGSDHPAAAFHSLKEAFLPAAGAAPFHLSTGELQNYAAGNAVPADRIVCESHIEICNECDEELRRLTASNDPQTRPATRAFRPWRVRESFTPTRVAAAIALISLLALIGLLWRQRTLDQSARNQPPPATTLASSPVNSPANEDHPPAKDSSDIATLNDNGLRIVLDREGNVTGLDQLDEPTRQMVKAALAGERVAKPQVLESLSSPRIQLLGEPRGEAAFRLLSPLGQVIIEDRPTLKWRALAGASGYVVSVFDGNFNRIAQSPPLTKTDWTLSVPLARGGIFSWEITATKDGKEISAPTAPAPRAQFKVLETEKLSALKKLEAIQPTSHLALGLTYAKFGLVNEAQAELRRLVKQNPQSAEARKLLRTVQQWR